MAVAIAVRVAFVDVWLARIRVWQCLRVRMNRINFFVWW